MLNSRDYRIIALSLTYMLANIDEVDRLHVHGGLPDLGKGKTPSETEVKLLLKRIRKLVDLSEITER